MIVTNLAEHAKRTYCSIQIQTQLNKRITYIVETKNMLLLQTEIIDSGSSLAIENCLDIAVECGVIEMVKPLLNCIKVFDQGFARQLLRVAAIHGHYEIVKCLTDDRRINMTIENNIALKMALGGRSFKTILLLLEVSTEKISPYDLLDCENEGVARLLLQDYRLFKMITGIVDLNKRSTTFSKVLFEIETEMNAIRWCCNEMVKFPFDLGEMITDRMVNCANIVKNELIKI
jgi:hypothetical protein